MNDNEPTIADKVILFTMLCVSIVTGIVMFKGLIYLVEKLIQVF